MTSGNEHSGSNGGWNGKYGTIETLTPAMAGTTQWFKLKPMSNTTITLVDTAGNPAAGLPVRLSLAIRYASGNTNMQTLSTAVTDSNGKAVLCVLPGKTSISLNLPGSFEEPLPLGKSIRSKIEKDIDLAPGATFDFGTVKLTKVFAENIP
jgi:hypothetical protein